MLQLNIQSVVQIIGLAVYAVLISLALCSKKVALKKLFTVLLAAACGVCLADFLTNLNLSYGFIVFWKFAAVLFTTWFVVAYAHFITAYAGKKSGKIVKAGYAWLGAALVVTAVGYLTQGAGLMGQLSGVYNYAITAVVIVNDAIVVAVALYIFKLLKNAAAPDERNRAGYLLAGGIIAILGTVPKYFVQGIPSAFVQAGYVLNAIIIAYTLMKYRLLDIQVLMRKWLVYTGVTVCMTLAYLTLLLVLSNLLAPAPAAAGHTGHHRPGNSLCLFVQLDKIAPG